MGLLFAKVEVNSVIDYGCATGIWLSECKRLGASTVLGLDGNWVDRRLIEIESGEFREHDLGVAKFIPKRKYDLALCIEVAEHIPEVMGERLIESITEASDMVLFSAAVCGQGGTGHISERPQHYWAEQVAIRGYSCIDLIRPQIWEHESVNVIYKQNMLLYARESICRKLDLKANVVSSSFDLDRIHPDLFVMRSAVMKSGRRGSFIDGLRLLARGLVGKR